MPHPTANEEFHTPNQVVDVKNTRDNGPDIGNLIEWRAPRLVPVGIEFIEVGSPQSLNIDRMARVVAEVAVGHTTRLVR